MDANDASVISSALAALPGLITMFRGAHAAANPDAPVLTEVQALAALKQVIETSLARDAQLRATFTTHSNMDVGNDVPNGGAA